MVYFHKGVLWNCERDEIDLCAAVEGRICKNTEWKSTFQNSLWSLWKTGVQPGSRAPWRSLQKNRPQPSQPPLRPLSIRCTLGLPPTVPAGCSQPGIRPNFFCWAWDSSDRRHLMEVSSLAWAKHPQNCTAGGSPSFSSFLLPCHLAWDCGLSLPLPAPLPLYPSPGCPPQISCTSISAVLSSASRIQTGPQRHTQLLTLTNLELGWSKGGGQDEGNYGRHSHLM